MATLAALAGRRLYLDTNVFIYALENMPKWASLAARVLRSVDEGACEAVTSELTLCECLVKPLQLQRNDIADVYLDFLRSRPAFSVVPVDRETLIQAARLRGTGVALPDAIHVATALRHGCTHFVTNDERCRVSDGIELVLLSELT